MRFIFIIIKSIAVPESQVFLLREAPSQPAFESGLPDEGASGRSKKKGGGVNRFNLVNLPSPETNPLLRL